jgi:ADP-ribose pyrophosphatase YjhB (NUDIX family)
VSKVARTDHYYNPDAPRANSIVVGVTAVVRNVAGDILLQRRTDNNLWALPGGAQDIGESVAETVVREVHEETGIEVEVAGLVGIYSNPHHVVEFSDGEVRQQFSICFHARPVGGELATSAESSDVRWVVPSELDQLPIHPSMRLRIDHGLTLRSEPYIG